MRELNVDRSLNLCDDSLVPWGGQADFLFLAITFETYGACSKKFEDLLKVVTNLAAQKNHIEPGVLLNYWRKRISTCLQVGNANILSDAFIYLFD